MSLYFNGSQANNYVKAPNHLKSMARLKAILFDMVTRYEVMNILYSQPALTLKDDVAVHADSGCMFNININADGEETVSQIVEMIFSQAILLGMSDAILIVVASDGSQIGLNISMEWDNGYFRQLKMLSDEIGSVTHTMHDISFLLNSYEMVTPSEDSTQAELRASYIVLMGALNNSKSVFYYSLSADSYNCLIETN